MYMKRDMRPFGTTVCRRDLYDKILQHTATRCNTLQHTATHYHGKIFMNGCKEAYEHVKRNLRHVLQCVAHTATHCNTLTWQDIAGFVLHVHRPLCTRSCGNTLQHTATHCNTLQHTATHCNTLQHTATHTCATHTCS